VTGDRPDGAALLAEARRALLEELLPLLPADRRYQALMVASAMAIAGREVAQPEDELRRVAEELAALGGAGGDAADEERRLAQDIRSGLYDAPGARRIALCRYLRAATLARVRISNPKALAR